MTLDNDKIDRAALALLYLGLHDVDRAWEGFDWEAMSRSGSRNHRQTCIPARPVRSCIARRCDTSDGGLQVILEGGRYAGGPVSEERKRWLTLKWSRRARPSV